MPNQLALVTDVAGGFESAATELKNTRILLNNNATDLSALTQTTKTNVVAALNQLKGLIDSNTSAVALAATIDDVATTAATDVAWSPQKIGSYVSSQIAAALEGEDLSDLADAVAAMAQADNGLLSFVAPQTLTGPQLTQLYSNIDISLATYDFAADFIAGLV